MRIASHLLHGASCILLTSIKVIHGEECSVIQFNLLKRNSIQFIEALANSQKARKNKNNVIQKMRVDM
jgi:hypothetical protein